MIHLPEHPHSFVKDNYVSSVAIFDGHDHELIENVRIALGADWVQCNCDYQRVVMPGAFWDGTDFLDLDGNKIPREPLPLEPEEYDTMEQL
jgi:hypothetical protein